MAGGGHDVRGNGNRAHLGYQRQSAWPAAHATPEEGTPRAFLGKALYRLVCGEDGVLFVVGSEWSMVGARLSS